MAVSADAPLSGVFRVVYFLAIGVTCLFVVITAVTAFYDPPAGENEFPGNGNPFFPDESFEVDNDRENYNRNVSLIFVATGAVAYVVAIFGLGARFNPLRAGLMLGGLLLFLTGMGFWTDSTNEWLGSLSATVILLVLLAGYLSLEDGFPLRPTGRPPPRRLTPEEVTMPRQDEPPPGDEPPLAPIE